ncbi:magnesium chelatase [Flavobacterium branchiophilum]|uniref:ATPase, MoxR family n=2 Tax=Flavobacterium branchiophilum TaxID=55197 RepID=G2Z1H2_FLABF|nr:MoxR family ATPase [Flavobacterium branchiophilum]OXA76950.1 magnesium chelatase [Flavobacterium branchiophilum] [Flavobacterium branchiophilum NBRC 15030 = ATCC 35035]PDS25163.1 MoxR family ATPase [Flavobacterium branchiophilum]TQM42190.1 MoxR-like ATPase [Flavobacterium branchiophilum]CCB69740.1 ATPase, MoxR family [Flavobacterium branchiophilum FL-15]GEM54515.1 magnesium chelatase subunit I [Flavobacterium branchiophilum NBRC 15030 = ATCC 35035]
MENIENVNFESRINLSPLLDSIQAIKAEIGSVIVGQEKMIDQLLVAILSNGHVLLEGVPGVAKTITAKLLAKTLNIHFSRIQFTPDLMPSDILGTSVFDLKKSVFEFKKGPIFSNLVLIDEINRAPAKTQAALFEVMEERQITIDGNEYQLEAPFLVIATQNPIEQEGTYRLPEAQLDRFLFKIAVHYPNLEQEIAIVQKEHLLQDKNKLANIQSILSHSNIMEYQHLVKKIIVENQLISYIAQIVINTRQNALLYLGASPRASIAILNAAKGFAAIRGRDFVTPEDIKEAAVPVLQHRVIVAPEREMEGITSIAIIKQIIESIEIPR